MSTSTLTSRDFQKKFGAITDKIASGESVQVTRYGRPAYYIIPESPEAKEYFRRVSWRRMIDRLQSMQSTPEAKRLTPEDINTLIHESFA